MAVRSHVGVGEFAFAVPYAFTGLLQIFFQALKRSLFIGPNLGEIDAYHRFSWSENVVIHQDGQTMVAGI